MGDRFEWNLIISGRNLIYKTGLNSDIFENHLIVNHKNAPLTGLRPGGGEIFIGRGSNVRGSKILGF